MARGPVQPHVLRPALYRVQLIVRPDVTFIQE